MRPAKASLTTALLSALIVALGLLVMTTGPLGVTPAELIRAVAGAGSVQAELALSLRMPRLLAALSCGAALAGAGAAFQILFRNPLASPDLLGVTSGAGLGAATALLLGAGAWMVQSAAFAGGLATGALALVCASLAGGTARGNDGRLALILCGIVAGALATAGLGLVVIAAEPYSQLPSITYWLLGSFTRADMGEVLSALGPMVVGSATLIWLGFRLDVLSLGQEQARSLGLPAGSLRVIALASAALMTSAAVAVAGVVGWIGLLAPHAARRLVGQQASHLVPASMAIGALAALAIDRLATAFGPAELPVGLLAALVGAPAFLALFIATARRA